MKSVLAFLALLSISYADAFVCNQNEAQFIGKVKDLRIVRYDQGVRDCYFKIDFTFFQQHALCPIDFSIANNNEVFDYDCSRSLENNQDISGVLIEKNNTLFIED